MKVRPSELVGMNEVVLVDGQYEPLWTNSQRLDFDLAVHALWEFIEAKREEKVKRTIPKEMKLGDKQYWHPRYSDADILEMYYKQDVSLGPVLDTLTETDVDNLLASWDENEVTYELDAFEESHP